MAKIDEYLRQILASRYGKDVRQSIHDAIDEINDVNESNISTVENIASENIDTVTSMTSELASEVSLMTSEAASEFSDISSEATAAVNIANTAASSASESAQNASTASAGAQTWYGKTKDLAESMYDSYVQDTTLYLPNSVASVTASGTLIIGKPIE